MAASEEDRRALGFAAEIAFLSQPQSYGEPTARVDTVETHLSWVFLTAQHAW